MIKNTSVHDSVCIDRQCRNKVQKHISTMIIKLEAFFVNKVIVVMMCVLG